MKSNFIHSLVTTAIFSTALCFPLSATAADSPAKADLYEGIEITVNINSAPAEELALMLRGIGSKKAAEIVLYRNENGAFMSADELVNVKGIGEATVAKNRDRIKL